MCNVYGDNWTSRRESGLWAAVHRGILTWPRIYIGASADRLTHKPLCTIEWESVGPINRSPTSDMP